MAQLTITIRVDPRQIQNMPSYGPLSHTRAQTVWTAAVEEKIKQAGFEVVVETGRDLDAYSDWHLRIGTHTIPSRDGKMEGFNVQELADILLGDCQCAASPCCCHARGYEVLTTLLPVLLHQAQMTVESALEQGEFAVEDAGRSL